MNKKTAIITGVTGQMGSYLTELCLSKGISVIGAVRRLSVPNNQNIIHITDPNFTKELMDLGDSHSISSFVEKHKPDYFFNCAANSFVGTSWDCPEQHFEYNTLGVLRQLEAIRKYSPKTRYLNFGSSEEFGNVQYSPQDEKHPPCSRSPYGASKVAARQIVKVYRESYNMFAIQPWCFNYESPRRGVEFVTRKITVGVARILHAISNRLDFEPIQLGNLDARRDWSHAKDFAEGVFLMIENAFPKEYVLSSGNTHTVRSFIERAFLVAGLVTSWKGTGINEKLVDEFDRVLVSINPKFFRPADVELLLGDSQLIRKELGWKPNYSFDNLITEMVNEDIKKLS